MIELIDFSKNYKNKTAVSKFSMRCEENEITGIIGLNGAGKTTILKAICARHFASSGQVVVNNIDASENPEQVRLMTGFVQEQSNLPCEFFVFEYIKMCASLFNCEENAIESVKKQCDLSEIWNEKIKNISKGQKERVNFAQALVHNPKILVLDEPASGLDPSQIIKMRNLVKSLKKNRTILLSTHLMQEVDALCDKIYIIHNGKCVENGIPSEIVTRQNAKNLEEAFFKLTIEK